MAIKSADEKPAKIEQLVVELFNKDMDFSMEEEGTVVRMYLDNWCLVLNNSGKWFLE